MSKLDDLATTDMSDIEAPTDIPSGTWKLRASAVSEKINDEADEDNGDALSSVTFIHVPVEPIADFDEALVEDGGWRGKRVFTRRDIRERSDVFELKDLIAAHGVGIERGYRDALPLMRNREVLADVSLKTFKRRDGTSGKTNVLNNFRSV